MRFLYSIFGCPKLKKYLGQTFSKLKTFRVKILSEPMELPRTRFIPFIPLTSQPVAK